MSDLKELMDDLAAERVTHLRIDLVAAGRRSAERRNWMRAHGTTLLLAAAAALVAVAFLLPLTLVPVVPATGSTGLPDRFYGIPGDLRTVDFDPIGRASMVLNDDQGRFFVVSADGKRYRRLPGVPMDQPVALSADGTRVAWVTWPEDVGGRSLYAVHVVDLVDGADRRYALGLAAGGGVAPHNQVVQLFWAGDLVYLRTEDRDLRWWWTRPEEPDDMSALSGGCPLATAGDGTGRLMAWTGTHVVPNNLLSACPTGEHVPADGPPKVLASPDGQALVTGNVEVVDSRVGLQIYGSGARRVQMAAEASGVTPMAWTAAGIVAEVGLSSDQQLVLVDPATGAVRTIGRSLGAHASPVAVAADLVGDGAPIRAPRPDFLPPVERGGLTTFLRDHGRPAELTAALVLTLAAGGVYLRRRRNA